MGAIGMAEKPEIASEAVRWRSLKTIRAILTATNLGIGLALILLLILLWPLFSAMVSLALRDDRYLQILIGPALCSFLVYWHRAGIFAEARYSPKAGVPLLLVSALASVAFTHWEPRGSLTLFLAQAAFALILASAFFLCFGARSFRAALYPLGCLLLMIPLPADWMDQLSAGLQHGSAEVSYALLRLTGTPVFRQGMRFSLPGLEIEVAPECSGIRSGLVFFTVGLLAASVFLLSGWRRLALILATIPISILKNAVRIVALSLLSIHVDRAFLDGPIHHRYGGALSLPLDFVLFVPLVFALRKSEEPAYRAGGGTKPDSARR